MKNLVIFLVLAVAATVVWAEEPVYFADENLKAAVEAKLGITDPNASDMLGLTSLDASRRGIVDPNGIQYAINLTSLNLEGNQITDISALTGLANLKILHLYRNQISDISALSGLTNLTTINLNYNNISDISQLSGLTNLMSLTLSQNNISDISALSGLTDLRSINLNSNNITDISRLSGLINLMGLSLSWNNISDISALSGLTNLTDINLSGNDISDVSVLHSLTNLKVLILHSNNISDISALSGLTNLRIVYLSGNPLNCPSYDTYIPLIETNNPYLYYFTYNPRPEICNNQPDIDVSPLIYDFGDVNLGEARSVLLTISNMGNGDLTLESLDFTPDSNSDFAISLAPQLPAVIAPEDSNDVEITFTPSVDGNSFAVLEISSDDLDEPIVQVDLIGVGVVVEVPPSEQIEQILEFFDTSVADGNLVGVGPGNSANKKLNALINMFEATSDLIVGEYFDDACGQLVDILKKCDGQVPPPDFVSGEAAEELANMILELMEDLECE